MLVHKIPVRGPGRLGGEVPSYPKPAEHCRNLGTPILKHLTQCHQQFECSLKLMSTVPVINASISYHSQQQIPRGFGLPSWWVISGTAYTLGGQPQGTCVHTHLLGALAFLPRHACPGPILLSERRKGRGTAGGALHSYSRPTPSFPFTAISAPWGIQGSSLSSILKALTSVGQGSQMACLTAICQISRLVQCPSHSLVYKHLARRQVHNENLNLRVAANYLPRESPPPALQSANLLCSVVGQDRAHIPGGGHWRMRSLGPGLLPLQGEPWWGCPPHPYQAREAGSWAGTSWNQQLQRCLGEGLLPVRSCTQRHRDTGCTAFSRSWQHCLRCRHWGWSQVPATSCSCWPVQPTRRVGVHLPSGLPAHIPRTPSGNRPGTHLVKPQLSVNHRSYPCLVDSTQPTLNPWLPSTLSRFYPQITATVSAYSK